MKIAIFIARGDSKRILGKNIKKFCGKPIIAWPIEVAKASGLFDHVIVSTDDAEIAEVVQEWGAEVPFMRPSELGKDNTSTDRVVLHALKESQRIYGCLKHGCCLYPTVPFLTQDDLRHGLDMLIDYQTTSAFPVVKYDFPIEQAFLLNGARPRAKWPDKLEVMSQNLPDHYHDAGMFYWFDVEKYLAEARLLCDDSVAFVIPSYRCQDINTLEDWEHAEVKFRVMVERNENIEKRR